MCEMCDKFKTCVACEYGGCEEHRAVEELAKPVNDSSVTAGTDRAVDAMKEVKNWFTDNYNDSTKVGIDPADDDGSNLDPNMYPNSDTTGGTTGGSQIRDNMFELLRDTIAAVPQKYWSRLGIGYTTMSGQSFPEACALHGADAPVSLGPQGEPLFRYSEDQPREPNGEFGSGGAATEAKTSENKEEHIASVIKDQVHKMVGDKDPSLINNGNCIVFAKKMEEQIPGAVRVGIPNVALYGKDREHTIAGDAGKPRVTVSIDRPVKADDMPSRIHSYLHQWVQVDGKNYDSETPNGVKNWKDLPYFKKGGAGRENLDIALASMLSKKDRSLANEQPEERYSDDQPRDPDGEFASGGGSNDPGKVIEHLNSENPVNPENDKERLVVVDGKTVGKFEVTEREGRLRIKGISSDTGNGNLVLGRITDAADKEGVTLELTASPYGSHKLDSDALKSWYGRHGFTMEQGYDEALGYMIREPNNDRSLSEPTELRFSEDQPRDPDGKFAGGEASGASAQSPEFEKQETKIEGDVKTTKYVSPNHSIIVEHNTKEGKVTVKHLDKNGDLLVQQTHDSIGAARKELQTQGIDHKFYALRFFGPQGEQLRADDEDGEWITINGAHVFIGKDGTIEKGPAAFVGKSPSDLKEKGASGESKIAKAAPQDKWKMAAGSREEFDRAVANTPGAKYTDKGLELDLSRYQPAEQAGAEAIRTGVFFLPELNSPYKSSYSTGKNGYGGGDKIEGRKEYLNPILTKGATGGKAPEKAYDMLKGKGAYEAMRSDALKVIGWNQSTSQKIDATREVLAKYGGKSDMASEIVQRSTQGNQLPYAIQEHIVACAVREAGHDAVIGYSKSKGAERLSEVFDVNMSEYPSESFRSYLALLEFRFNADQPRDPDGEFASGGTSTSQKDIAARPDFSGSMKVPGGTLTLSQNRTTKVAEVQAFAKSEMSKLPAGTQAALNSGMKTSDMYKTGDKYNADRVSSFHNPVIDKALAGKTPQDSPKVVFVGGGPAAGKTTASDDAARNMSDHVAINVDDIRTAAPEFTALLPDRLMPINEETGDIRDRLISEAGDARYNMIIDGVGSKSAAENVANLVGKGYTASYVYVHREVGDAQQRADDRPYMTSKIADMRILPQGMVEGFHDKARGAFSSMAKVSSEVKVIDKSQPEFGKEGKVVFWKDGSNIKVYDAEGVKRVENGGKTKIRIYP